MKVVVTGGSGQLGTLVLERLISKRQVKKIVSLDLVPPRVPSPKLDYRIADLKDPGLERYLEGADALIHMAFIVSARASAETMQAVNVEGSRRLFEAAAAHGVKKIVYLSSIAAYGIAEDQPTPFVESLPRRRTGFLTYADNKYEVEEILDRFEAEHPSVEVVRLRPGLLLGRRISHIDERLLGRRLMPIVEGSARPPLVWDEDVADAVLLGLFSDKKGAFNLVAEEPLDAESVARLAGFRVVSVSTKTVSAVGRVASVLRGSDNMVERGWLRAAMIDQTASPEKAKRELGWKPKYPTCADVARVFGKSIRGRPDPRIMTFMRLLGRLGSRAAEDGEMPREGKTLEMRIHLDLTGARGADFDLHVDHGTLTLRRGIPRPPDAVVTISAKTFLDLLSGKEDPSTAAMVGKIRIRGEAFAGFVVSGIISGFRRATARSGPPGSVARGLERWFARGVSE